MINEKFSIYDFINDEALAAFHIIKYSTKSLFLTGKAGSGKSTIIELIRRDVDKKMEVLSMTGVAAQNVSGKTVHSFFKIPIGEVYPDDRRISDIKYRKEKEEEIIKMELIVLDEASTLPSYTLDCIDSIFRKVRKCDSPFGGVQMLFVGDPFQLPPVFKEGTILKKPYKSTYFWESISFQEIAPFRLELEKSYRQSEKIFLQTLDEIRDESISDERLQALNRICVRPINLDNYDGIVLTSTNKPTDSINLRRLSLLDGKEYRYDAQQIGNFNLKDCNAEQELNVKIGARVMFIANDPKKRYHNGLTAVVEEVFENCITVRTDSGVVINVERHFWENRVCAGGVDEVEGSLRQFYYDFHGQ